MSLEKQSEKKNPFLLLELLCWEIHPVQVETTCKPWYSKSKKGITRSQEQKRPQGASIDYIMAFSCIRSLSFEQEKEKLVVNAHFNSLHQLNISCKVSDGRMTTWEKVRMPPGKTSGAIRRKINTQKVPREQRITREQLGRNFDKADGQ